MKTKHLPVYRTISRQLRRLHPELRRCNSASEASRIIFGVKSLTHLIHTTVADRDALLAFFGKDISGLVEWAKYGKVDAAVRPGSTYRYESDGGNFHIKPEHLKAYRLAVKELGLQAAVAITNNYHGADTLKGLAYLRADKKRWARFQTNIVAALPNWPAHTQQVMIHDYAVKVEADAHRVVTPRKSLDELPVTMPQLPLSSEITVGDEKYQVMVPRHDADMRAIGRAQNHCVGTAAMGYGDRVRGGSIHIVAIYRKSLADGICVEFDSDDLDIRQAQGRHRRGPNEAERQVISRVRSELVAAH